MLPPEAPTGVQRAEPGSPASGWARPGSSRGYIAQLCQLLSALLGSPATKHSAPPGGPPASLPPRPAAHLTRMSSGPAPEHRALKEAPACMSGPQTCSPAADPSLRGWLPCGRTKGGAQTWKFSGWHR